MNKQKLLEVYCQFWEEFRRLCTVGGSTCKPNNDSKIQLETKGQDLIIKTILLFSRLEIQSPAYQRKDSYIGPEQRNILAADRPHVSVQRAGTIPECERKYRKISARVALRFCFTDPVCASSIPRAARYRGFSIKRFARDGVSSNNRGATGRYFVFQRSNSDALHEFRIGFVRTRSGSS